MKSKQNTNIHITSHLSSDQLSFDRKHTKRRRAMRRQMSKLHYSPQTITTAATVACNSHSKNKQSPEQIEIHINWINISFGYSLALCAHESFSMGILCAQRKQLRNMKLLWINNHKLEFHAFRTPSGVCHDHHTPFIQHKYYHLSHTHNATLASNKRTIAHFRPFSHSMFTFHCLHTTYVVRQHKIDFNFPLLWLKRFVVHFVCNTFSTHILPTKNQVTRFRCMVDLTLKCSSENLKKHVYVCVYVCVSFFRFCTHYFRNHSAIRHSE